MQNHLIFKFWHSVLIFSYLQANKLVWGSSKDAGRKRQTLGTVTKDCITHSNSNSQFPESQFPPGWSKVGREAPVHAVGYIIT